MKALLIAFLLLTVPVLAAHTSVVTISPHLTGLSKEAGFSLNVENKGKDSVSEVRISIPIEFSELKCGAAPGAWRLAFSDAVECSYKTVSNYTNAGKSLVFSVNATTAAKDGNYTWEVRTRDIFDGFWLLNPVTAIDGTAPKVAADVLEVPNGGEKWEAGSRHDILWHSRNITDANLAEKPITLEYSTDGKAWKLVIRNLENNGAYNWLVPVTPSNSTLVRITAADESGNTASDASNAPFAIVAPVPVTTIKTGQSATLDVNKDNKNDTKITVKGIANDTVSLIVASVVAASPAPTPSASPAPVAVTSPAMTAIIIILVLIILYLLWRLNKVKKK